MYLKIFTWKYCSIYEIFPKIFSNCKKAILHQTTKGLKQLISNSIQMTTNTHKKLLLMEKAISIEKKRVNHGSISSPTKEEKRTKKRKRSTEQHEQRKNSLHISIHNTQDKFLKGRLIPKENKESGSAKILAFLSNHHIHSPQGAHPSQKCIIFPLPNPMKRKGNKDLTTRRNTTNTTSIKITMSTTTKQHHNAKEKPIDITEHVKQLENRVREWFSQQT